MDDVRNVLIYGALGWLFAFGMAAVVHSAFPEPHDIVPFENTGPGRMDAKMLRIAAQEVYRLRHRVIIGRADLTLGL